MMPIQASPVKKISTYQIVYSIFHYLLLLVAGVSSFVFIVGHLVYHNNSLGFLCALTTLLCVINTIAMDQLLVFNDFKQTMKLVQYQEALFAEIRKNNTLLINFTNNQADLLEKLANYSKSSDVLPPKEKIN